MTSTGKPRRRSLVAGGALALWIALPACAAARTPRPGAQAPVTGPLPSGRAVSTSLGSAGMPVGLGGGVRLDELIPILLQRNPSIRQAREWLRAARERFPQAIALPDPMVEASWYARNAMSPDGRAPTRWTLMLRQEMPFPTVLALRGQGARMEALREAVRYEATVRDAITQLRDVHAERAYLVEAENVSQGVRDIYIRLAELARSGVEQGRTTLPESFRAESLAAQAAYDLVGLNERRAVEDARLRAMLDLPTTAPVGAPADSGSIVDLGADAEALWALAERNNQDLRAAGIDRQVAEIAVRRARAELAPALDLGFGYMKTDDYDPMLDRGEDSVVLTLGITLPVVNPGRHAAVREADALAGAARASEAERRQRLRADVARAAYRVRTSARLAALYSDTLLPQAERALGSSRQLVAEGKESLASTLELAATWQAMRIAQARAHADNAQSTAALERLLGTTLAATPAGGRR